MRNLFNFKTGTAVLLFLCISFFQLHAGNLSMAVVLGAANKLNDVNTDNIKFSSVDVMDVTADLDAEYIPALNDVLMKVEADDILKRLLKKAKLIDNEQIVVGVLTTDDGAVSIVLVADKKLLR